jgi:exopolyphosphatase/guanosine-5'-triphosphate,3'-diphosphate pyrophosphatase
MSRKIYIAAPFSSKTTNIKGRAYGEINDFEFITLLERLEKVLTNAGLQVALPHRDKGRWGKHYIEPPHIARICCDMITECDVVIALPQQSRGVHFEIGWATALGKKVILLVRKDEDVSIFTSGLPYVGDVTIHQYLNEDDLINQVERLANTLTESAQQVALSDSSRSDCQYAIIDLGSSTFKLYVATVTDNFINYIKRVQTSEISLSDDVNKFKQIQSHTIEKVAELLLKWKRDLQVYDHLILKVIATGAVRMADNRLNFIRSLKAATGVDITILNASQEAEILYKGTVFDFAVGEDHVFFVLNVGGGTTELITGSKSKIDRIYTFESMGIRKLNQMLQSDPPTDEEYERLVGYVNQLAKQIETQDLPEPEKVLFIHTGGELDYVLAAGCPLEDSALSPTHPKKIQIDDFRIFAQRIRKMSKKQLYQLAPNPENPHWMDGAIASNVIASCIANRIGAKEIIPSNRNIADGLILQLKEGVI